MNWTNEKPTVAGWYWMQVAPRAPEMIHVVRGPRDDPYHLYAHFRTGNNKTFDGPLVVLDGQFAGPIPEPTDHPVDALKACGVQMDPEAEKQMRAVCDEIIPPLQAKAEAARDEATFEDKMYWNGYIDGLNKKDVFPAN